MVGALESRVDAGIAYCGWQNIGLGPGRDIPYVPPDYENGNKFEALLRACPWPIHGALVRRAHFRVAGDFDTSLSTSEDYDLWLRLASVYRLARVPRVLAYYHHHDGNHLTGDKGRVALNHLRAQEKFLFTHAKMIKQLGRRRIRKLTLGELLHRGYIAYWKRDLPAARTIFRQVMKHWYGRPMDWLYMLPSWLPENCHRRLLEWREAAGVRRTDDQP
jgi:hypothetical protein